MAAVTPRAVGLADGGNRHHQGLWRPYLTLSLAGAGLFFLPTVGRAVGWGLLYVALCLLSVLAILLGVRRNRPARPLAWYILAAGYVVLTVGNLVWYPYALWTTTTLPYPSISDGLFLSSYVTLLVGLVVLLHGRSAGRDRAGLLDAAIIASGIGMLAWVYLIQPQLQASALSLAGQATTVAYPLVDIMLVGILARMAFAPTVRGPAFWLLSLGLLAQLAGDVVYAVTVLDGSFTFASAALPLYALSWGLVGAAALHPSMATLSDPTRRHDDRGERWRLVPLTLAALTPSAVGVLQSVNGSAVNVPALSGISAVLFVLVLARVAGLMEDITRYHRVEQLRNQFVSLVSHELRTPLTSIRGALGLIASGRLGPLRDDTQEMLDIAVRNTQRLGRLLDDILDLERMDSGTLTMASQPCSARGLVDQAADAMRPMAEQAAVPLRVAGPDATVAADPYRVVQALGNLLGNAIKFSPPGATVWVTVEPRRDQVLVRVKDQGRGIPADKLETIFGRFEQVDSSDARDKGGSGLGLAICRSIIEQHGGRVWVHSTLGQGSTFSFTLPLLAAGGQQPSDHPHATTLRNLAH
jgi:signal transduction histidine kinase